MCDVLASFVLQERRKRWFPKTKREIILGVITVGEGHRGEYGVRLADWYFPRDFSHNVCAMVLDTKLKPFMVGEMSKRTVRVAVAAAEGSFLWVIFHRHPVFSLVSLLRPSLKDWSFATSDDVNRIEFTAGIAYFLLYFKHTCRGKSLFFLNRCQDLSCIIRRVMYAFKISCVSVCVCIYVCLCVCVCVSVFCNKTSKTRNYTTLPEEVYEILLWNLPETFGCSFTFNKVKPVYL